MCSQLTSDISSHTSFTDFDDLTCHVTNSIGESEPCPAEVSLPLTVARIEPEELLIIIIICAVVVAILLLASVATCFYCHKKSAANKGEN